MKASFQSCQPLKKGNMSVFSFTYILVAASSLLSYPSSPAQACVSAEEQVYHRTRLKEKKKKKTCFVWRNKDFLQSDLSKCQQEEKNYFPAWVAQLHFPCLPVLLLWCSSCEPLGAKNISVLLLYGATAVVCSEPENPLVVVVLGVCLWTILPKASQPSPPSLLINTI